MNCSEAQFLLLEYLDATLDMTDTLAVEEHLQECESCSQLYHNHQALQMALKTGSLYFQAPEQLRKHIQLPTPKEKKAVRIPWVISWRGLSAAAALIVVLFFLLWGITHFWPSSPSPVAGNALAQQVLTGHIRSLMGNHLIDIQSSNRHTVKPWFDGKLAFSPPVVDLTAQGFPLVGGRLDYLDNQPVAAVVYKRRLHWINLFIWPSTQNRGSGMDTTTLQGYHLIDWTKSGMTYWAVSDVDLNDLRHFVQLVQAST